MSINFNYYLFGKSEKLTLTLIDVGLPPELQLSALSIHSICLGKIIHNSKSLINLSVIKRIRYSVLYDQANLVEFSHILVIFPQTPQIFYISGELLFITETGSKFSSFSAVTSC